MITTANGRTSLRHVGLPSSTERRPRLAVVGAAGHGEGMNDRAHVRWSGWARARLSSRTHPLCSSARRWLMLLGVAAHRMFHLRSYSSKRDATDTAWSRMLGPVVRYVLLDTQRKIRYQHRLRRRD